MNGSEHSIGGYTRTYCIYIYTSVHIGVGYAAEVHLYHRSTRFPNMETALKSPNGVVAISLFLNVIHIYNYHNRDNFSSGIS